MKNYLESCQSGFWNKVFEKELEYILRELKGYRNILTVGCGPAIIERGLLENGFDVTGLDVSKGAFEGAPDGIRTEVGSAENMEFADNSFDAVIYVASLQFIDDYSGAVQETARVIRPGGKLLVMLLNPGSEFVRLKLEHEPDSYMQKMKHGKAEDIAIIEAILRKYFDSIETSYYLGIRGQRVFQSQDPKFASLYIINGVKK